MNSVGLIEKFHVHRLDGRDQPGGDKDNAKYFVLDYVNDPYAIFALIGYAASCREEYPELAADIDKITGRG